MNLPIQLLTPGPTPVPERIRQVGAQPMIHHRSEEFGAVIASLRKKLIHFYDTDGDVVMLSSSGTGGLEASVASHLSPGDEVLIVEAGKFGQRWEKLAAQYKLSADIIHVPWGKTVTVKEVASRLKPTTKAVLIQACESSTGVFNPISQIGETLKKTSTLFIVDAITALGIHELSMVKDHIDVLVCASQKAFMCPPGLAMVGLSAKALPLIKKNAGSFYFSLHRELEAQRKNSSAFTPAISLYFQLLEALTMMELEGKENLFKRHKLMHHMARSAFLALGMTLFNADEEATLGITVVNAPDFLDVKSWLKKLRKDYNLWLAGGQDQLEGKIFRISHMGAIYPLDLIRAIETIEDSLKEQLPAAREKLGSLKAKALYEGAAS